MNSQIVVLDGGMGKHLERSGAPFGQPEWSALALLEEPDAVRRAHADFVAAGADVVIANAYAVVPFHLGEERFAERGRELATLAGRLAREAADAGTRTDEQTGTRTVRVAGSLPPLFGSYEPDLFRPDEAPAHFDILVEAQAPFVDLWIGETVSSIAEAEAIIAALDRHDPSAELWMSFSVPDDPPGTEVALRSGESIEAAVAAVASRVSAILFNCSPPEAITVALGQARAALGANPGQIQTGGYANAFEPKIEGYAANEVILGRREDLTPAHYHDVVEKWVVDGATIVGGCCQIYPEHIEALTSLRSN